MVLSSVFPEHVVCNSKCRSQPTLLGFGGERDIFQRFMKEALSTSPDLGPPTLSGLALVCDAFLSLLIM